MCRNIKTLFNFSPLATRSEKFFLTSLLTGYCDVDHSY